MSNFHDLLFVRTSLSPILNLAEPLILVSAPMTHPDISTIPYNSQYNIKI